MSFLGFSAGTSSPCLIAVLKCWTLPLESANRLWHDLFLLLKHNTYMQDEDVPDADLLVSEPLSVVSGFAADLLLLFLFLLSYISSSAALSAWCNVTTCYRRTEAMMWMHNQPTWRHLLTHSCLWSAVSETEDVWVAAAADITRITFLWPRLWFTKWSDRNSVQL